MRPVFVQFRCAPGQTYKVADAIYDREVVSELYSTSGDYDLMAKVYIPRKRMSVAIWPKGCSTSKASAAP